MNIEEIKKINLADYLQCMGYSPVRKKGNSLWYKSPFREEKESSFKVNTEINLWYDFGIGKGGNIIALAEQLYKSTDIRHLMGCIAEKIPHIRPADLSFGQQKISEPSFQELKIQPLESPALFSYLKERGIDVRIARAECKELRYEHDGKKYFAIGFPNMAGGYEVRNRYFKGCIAPKNISLVRQAGEPRATCYLFEGFMDYLSFLSIRVNDYPEHPRIEEKDYVILNSVSNLAKAEHLLHSYTRIGCFLDNDRAGRATYESLKRTFGERLRDMSPHYAGHKDLNDYLCHRNRQEKVGKKEQDQSSKRMQKPQPERKGGFRL